MKYSPTRTIIFLIYDSFDEEDDDEEEDGEDEDDDDDDDELSLCLAATLAMVW